MQINLTNQQYRYLLDLVYVGNWVMNANRGDDRIEQYDDIESKLFEQAKANGMGELVEHYVGVARPSVAYVEGGIHEVILDYEDTVFFGILAEELARRDLNSVTDDDCDADELAHRIEMYMDEFTEHGIENVQLSI